MTDPRPGSTSDSATPPDTHEAARRPSYGQRRRDRIDALATAGVDEEPGVSLIRSAWNRLRRNPVFVVSSLRLPLMSVAAAVIVYEPSAGSVTGTSTELAPSGTRAS